jgi:hypothetical protein
MIELIRIPAKHPDGRKYDYTTPDGRWHVEYFPCYGGGWSVVDTSGEIRCATHPGHATDVKTLQAAKAFITEWSA